MLLTFATFSVLNSGIFLNSFTFKQVTIHSFFLSICTRLYGSVTSSTSSNVLEFHTHTHTLYKKQTIFLNDVFIIQVQTLTAHKCVVVVVVQHTSLHHQTYFIVHIEKTRIYSRPHIIYNLLKNLYIGTYVHYYYPLIVDTYIILLCFF